MKSKLTEAQRRVLMKLYETGPWSNYKRDVMVAPDAMRPLYEAGLAVFVSPRCQWEITDAGRAALRGSLELRAVSGNREAQAEMVRDEERENDQ